MKNWDLIKAELNNIETITDINQIAKLSLDYYYFSPILTSKLQNKTADLIVLPNNEQEVLTIAKICVKYQIPLTIRGAGTGNYGQSIPLNGGIILDTSKMNQILELKAGFARVQPGVKMANFDKKARQIGWELRMIPSTYKVATIGGFIGGGSGGIGSITYGQLRDRGNLNSVRVVTLENEPRIIELRGDETQKINHAYGTNGIITALEIPLAPAHNWLELIVVFDDFITALKFGQKLSDSDGIIKKLVSIYADPIPQYFTALKSFLPNNKSCALIIISEYDLFAFKELVKEFNGDISYYKNSDESLKGISLIEFSWNHTTLHARNIDANITYLQTFFFTLEKVEEMYHKFGDEVMIHIEFLRVEGKAIPAGLQLIRFTTENRLNEIIKYHEENGAFIANPHTYILEDGGRKEIDFQQLEFKQKIDPFGLLNQGKMRAFEKKMTGIRA